MGSTKGTSCPVVGLAAILYRFALLELRSLKTVGVSTFLGLGAKRRPPRPTFKTSASRLTGEACHLPANDVVFGKVALTPVGELHMVGWYEIVGERADPRKVGSVKLNTFYETRKKNAWFVALQGLALVAMIAAGYAVTVTWIPMALWQSCTLVAGIMLMYVGVAFFVRPEADRTTSVFWAA